MFRLFFTPGWFNGVDLLFEVISLIVAFSISLYSYRLYRVSKENKFVYFSLALLAITLSFLFKIVTFANLYYSPIREIAVDVLRPTVLPSLRYADLLYRAGFFLQMATMLGGLLLIFLVSQKSRKRLTVFHEISQIMLFLYFILLVSIVGTFEYFIFYLTSVVLLTFIVLNYYKNYLNTGRSNTLLVMTAFLVLLISQLLFIFVSLDTRVYVIAEGVQLLAFLIVLYAYMTVKRGVGRKK